MINYFVTTLLRYVGGLVWDFLPPRFPVKPPTEIPQRGPLFCFCFATYLYLKKLSNIIEL